MQENHSRAFFLLHISRHHTSHSHNLAHLEIESHCSPQAVTVLSLISTGGMESFEPLEAAVARQPHLDLSVHAWTRLVARLLKIKNICKKYFYKCKKDEKIFLKNILFVSKARARNFKRFQ